MKSRILILILSITFGTTALYAESGTCGDNLTWTFENGVLTISGYGEMKNYDHSYDYSGDKAAPWMSFRNDIKKVIISNDVTSIGYYAFSGCGNLTSITIPNNVTRIGSSAFFHCKSLTSINVAAGNLYYSSDNGVLFDKNKTTLIQYPKSKYGNSYIIPNSVTSIGEYAFYECNSLTSIEIPHGVTTIEWAAFYDCSSLTSVTIPNSVTEIGSFAFSGCTGLTAIIIPNSVTSIGRQVFQSCSGLSTVTIGNSVTKISIYAFDRCIRLTSINVSQNNLNYSSIDGVLFDRDQKTLMRYPSGMQNSSYSIPNSVTSIGWGAFEDCNSLTSITIPNSVVKIGIAAFCRCYNLTSITIPNSVTSIGEHAFSECTNLTSVTIPNSVTSIGRNAFFHCTNLTSVTIPNSVTSIGDYAFSDCENLLEIYYPEWLDLSEAGIPSSTKLIAYAARKPNPPLLALVDEITFTDATGNAIINTNEQCAIRFKVQNTGKGDAENCEARVTFSGTTSGISVQNVKLPTIAVGDTYEVEIPVTSDINTEDGKVSFSVEVFEPDGWGVPPFDLSVTTKAYDPPFLQVVDYATNSKSGKIGKVDPFSIAFKLQNTAYGDAEDVKVKIKIPENVSLLVGESELSYPVIKSGEEKDVKITIAASLKYPSDNIPVTIDIQEKHGKYAENKTLNIALNQTTTGPGIVIAPKPGSDSNRGPIQISSLRSDVDKDIPETDIRNDNTFVLIIANEHYNYVEGVPYAINDGNIFREYCIKTLGINERQIQYIPDATGGMIRSGINKLNRISENFDNPHIIVYYAGHGIPNESNKSAYLLPVDGSATDVATGYKLDSLYAKLGRMPASQITVFMDACFSGSKREDGMLASARGVALKAKSGVPQGKMVVFSAAQGDETAYPNKEQQHGMFTYYLLKKLKETEGDISLKELGDYVTKQVRQQSLLLNDKQQTPCVTASAEVAQEWQTWTLK